MYTHPDSAPTLVHDRHRAMRAEIGSDRLARQLRDKARTERRARTFPYRLRRTWHLILQPRAHA